MFKNKINNDVLHAASYKLSIYTRNKTSPQKVFVPSPKYSAGSRWGMCWTLPLDECLPARAVWWCPLYRSCVHSLQQRWTRSEDPPEHSTPLHYITSLKLLNYFNLTWVVRLCRSGTGVFVLFVLLDGYFPNYKPVERSASEYQRRLAYAPRQCIWDMLKTSECIHHIQHINGSTNEWGT